ncbi:hypothetical protein [Mycobacteroides abscessus]|uniref:hypothetical protein n=1 Tax=Mycobacteroides abscessus TaxID=36809 RepID=UPI0002EE5F16|nr:hypothetical protein [Mycobacteroides abscessus]MBL3735119.1 hypothetical protein [Mycobacteroides abscessus subsp. massiliense]MBL3743951.1 hypothetical protein [Mycobacteroides abscessus subsp. massiliense]MBL3758723.1 hypothetical protein [Mycobacteroides abscessus subsp. massiliense]MBN7483741.1 hypothetical protein [Mycobacteroides abscessus subsp. massiliense]MDB2215593.1 hypothetical protein [Mycobacteroides abscessus subsp. massiliense]
MSGKKRSTEQLIAVTECRDLARSGVSMQELLTHNLERRRITRSDSGRRLAAFAGGSVLVVGAVAAVHDLYRDGDGASALIAWSGLLLLALTALGGGIKLAMWGVRPVITALFDRAKERLAEPVLAVVASGAVIVGALGMWWTLRGGYASWWQGLTGESRWSLSLGVGQMLVAVAAGAALFTGGRYVTGLAKDALTESGLLIERDRAAGRRRTPEGLWHPGLVAALVGGGLGLVVMTAWLTPKLAPTIVGANTLAAVTAIVAVLVWGVGANLGWWKGLAGLWQWATDASHKAAAMSGVVALLMFSAGGLGLGWFTPATVPQAHAQCPPDCGGGSNGGSYGPDASQFQPPQMPGQMPDYQGGINQPALDQNSSISIYNTQAPSVSNNGVQGSSGQQGPQQGWDQPAHGTQIPDYQNATPYTQGPGRPNPDFNPGSQGGQANQGAQSGNQGAQQQPPQNQLPQNNTGRQTPQQNSEQPNQSDQQKIDDLTRQLQDQQQQSSQDRQRIDDLTKQLQQNKSNQKQQQSSKFPSKDKKKDDKDEQDQQDDNDSALLTIGATVAVGRRRDSSEDPDEKSGDTGQDIGQSAEELSQQAADVVQQSAETAQQVGQRAAQVAQTSAQVASTAASAASASQGDPAAAASVAQQGTQIAQQTGQQAAEVGQQAAQPGQQATQQAVQTGQQAAQSTQNSSLPTPNDLPKQMLPKQTLKDDGDFYGTPRGQDMLKPGGRHAQTPPGVKTKDFGNPEAPDVKKPKGATLAQGDTGDKSAAVWKAGGEEGKGSFLGADTKGKASAEALSVHGKAEYKVSSDGLSAGANASANLVRVDAEGSIQAGVAKAEGSVSAAVDASASAQASITKTGVNIGADAFAGAEATAKGSVDLGGVGAGVTATGYAGVGAAANVDVGVKDGKLTAKGTLGAALGLGGKIKIDVSIDPKAIATNIGKGVNWLLGGS